MKGSQCRPDHQDSCARRCKRPAGEAEAHRRQAHDGRSAENVLNDLGKGQTLLADIAYDSDALRRRMQEKGGWTCIKPMPTRKNVPAFSPFLYRYRNVVERFFCKLKHFRAVAARYEKHDDNYLALVKLAASRICMRFMSR